MSNQIADIQRILSTEDEEFRKWLDEHHACESRLGELTTKNEVSIDEESMRRAQRSPKLARAASPT